MIMKVISKFNQFYVQNITIIYYYICFIFFSHLMGAVFHFQRRCIDRELGKAYILASMSKYRGIN